MTRAVDALGTCWTVKVRRKDVEDGAWRWIDGVHTYPEDQWWRRALWPTRPVVDAELKYWRSHAWETRIVKVTPKRSKT